MAGGMDAKSQAWLETCIAYFVYMADGLLPPNNIHPEGFRELRKHQESRVAMRHGSFEPQSKPGKVKVTKG